jgi:hypothetical protein
MANSGILIVMAVMIAGAAFNQKRIRVEEKMKYSAEDLEGWEFKIVRTTNTWSGFNNPATFQKVVDEESRAGWIFLEKFDNYRIRFKRKSGQTYPQSGIDPYRTIYGDTYLRYVLILFAGLLTLGIFFLNSFIRIKRF